MRQAICQVLKHGHEPSDGESSCPCYCSQIEGVGLHVVNITRYQKVEFDRPGKRSPE